MKKIIYFYIDDCPFCDMADRAFAELAAEDGRYAAVEVDKINEKEHPEIADRYDYYYVPTFFIDGEKTFEAYFMIPYEEVREGVRVTLDAALR